MKRRYSPEVLERARLVLRELGLPADHDLVHAQSVLACAFVAEHEAERAFWAGRLQEKGHTDPALMLATNTREDTATFRSRLLEAIRLRPWVIRNCSLCQYPLTFQYHRGQFGFDSGCNCSPNPEGWTPRDESEIEYYLNPAHGYTLLIEAHIRACGLDVPGRAQATLIIPGHEIPDPSVPRH